MSEATTTKKKPIIDVFLGGAKRGFYIGVETVLPSMILGYVIMQFLTLTGLMDVLATVCAPIMRLFVFPAKPRPFCSPRSSLRLPVLLLPPPCLARAF